MGTTDDQWTGDHVALEVELERNADDQRRALQNRTEACQHLLMSCSITINTRTLADSGARGVMRTMM
jgi:hypothetical protein